MSPGFCSSLRRATSKWKEDQVTVVGAKELTQYYVIVIIVVLGMEKNDSRWKTRTAISTYTSRFWRITEITSQSDFNDLTSTDPRPNLLHAQYWFPPEFGFAKITSRRSDNISILHEQVETNSGISISARFNNNHSDFTTEITRFTSHNT